VAHAAGLPGHVTGGVAQSSYLVTRKPREGTPVPLPRNEKGHDTFVVGIALELGDRDRPPCRQR
jgi:hypothetical protein